MADPAEGQAPEEAPQESTPAPDDTDALGVDAQSEEHTTEEPVEKPKKNRGFQKRIHGLTERLQKQQDEIDSLRAASAKPEAAAPKQEDFQDYEQFLEARAEYVAEKKFTQLRTEEQQKQQQQAQRQQANEQASQWEDTLQASRDKYEDFDDVALNEEVPISNAMSDAVREGTQGGEVAYYLGKNLKEAAAIARMTKIAQVKAIGAIEERLKERPDPRPTLPKPVTRGKTSSSTAPVGLSDDMPMEAWQAMRAKQVGRS